MAGTPRAFQKNAFQNNAFQTGIEEVLEAIKNTFLFPLLGNSELDVGSHGSYFFDQFLNKKND